MAELPPPKRPAPLFPARDGRDSALTFVIAVLVFLGCISVFAGLAADRAAAGWRQALGSAVTVQVRPKPDETPSEAASRAAEALAGVKGVTETAVIDRAAAARLLEPWIGAGALPDDLPIPRLVTVELDPIRPASASALRAAAAAAGVDAVVDDHSAWLADVKRAGGAIRVVVAFAALLILAAAAGTVVFATRAGLAARHDVIAVLHLTGAEDAYIAGLVQRRFAWSAALAAAYGAVAAVLIAAGLRLAGGAGGIVPVLPLAWRDLLAAAAAPLLTALVAAIAARRAAMSNLRSER